MAFYMDRQQIRNDLTDLAKDVEFVDNFNYLMQLMYEIAKDRGWHNPSKSFPEEVLMMHTELSEVVEEYREQDGNINSVHLGINGKPEGVPIEFSDLQIRLFDTCAHRKIDLFSMIITKSLFNLNRPNRHGEKKI